jgi:hypothetical protein
MDLSTYVSAGSLVLVPVIYIVGMILKGTQTIPDKFIPVILLVVGIVASLGVNGFNANSVIQGVLVTGVAVYTNQLIKQVTDSSK